MAVINGGLCLSGSPSQWCAKKTRSRMSQSRGSGSPHAPRPRYRRVVLDAVEIVSKKRSRGRMADPTPSHYPSPPVSRAPRAVAVHDSPPGSPMPLPHTMEPEDHTSPEPTLPLKTSKYFARASVSPTRVIPPILTPPSSPMLTIPVYIESSDFEYPPLDGSVDEPAEGTVDESPSWDHSPGLFDDLMIMLRRLKPILVQGGSR